VIEIRNAVPSDAGRIADAHVASWRAAYRPFFPASYLDSEQFAATRHTNWSRWVVDRPEGAALFVPLLDGRVVGFAHAGPERIQGDAAAPSGAAAMTTSVGGEVYGFYLHPDAWGSGAATGLMAACVDHLVAAGFAAACLWVLRDNGRARAFYEKAGWHATGRDTPWTPSDAPELTVIETRYERELAGT
jgi:GNAT superfamily N-acetyltransferase